MTNDNEEVVSDVERAGLASRLHKVRLEIAHIRNVLETMKLLKKFGQGYLILQDDLQAYADRFVDLLRREHRLLAEERGQELRDKGET